MTTHTSHNPPLQSSRSELMMWSIIYLQRWKFWMHNAQILWGHFGLMVTWTTGCTFIYDTQTAIGMTLVNGAFIHWNIVCSAVICSGKIIKPYTVSRNFAHSSTLKIAAIKKERERNVDQISRRYKTQNACCDTAKCGARYELFNRFFGKLNLCFI